MMTLLLGLTLLGVAALANPLRAQAPPVKEINIHGTVVNATSGQPLVGAFVSLSGARWGTVTNSRGRFTLRRVEPGHVVLSASQLGYKSAEWKGVVAPGQDTVKVPLPPEPKLLKGLKVENARFARRRAATAASVIAFDHQQLATTTWDNVVDFLNARAGLMSVQCPYWVYSPDCYWVDGEVVSPIVYIDEVPVAGGMDDLATMWPHDLYMLEVYGHGAEIRAYTKPFITRGAGTDFRPLAMGF